MASINNEFDPFWMFKTQSSLHLPESASDISSLGMESFDMERILTNFGISTLVISALDKIISWADTKYSEYLVKDFLNYLKSGDLVKQSELIPEITFDLILISYVAYMLKANAKSKCGTLKSLTKGSYKWLTEEKQPSNNNWFANWMSWIGQSVFENFKIVPPLINKRLFAFITNCYKPFGYLNKEDYGKLLAYYLLEKHTQYEQLIPLSSHPLGRYSILELLSPPKGSDTVLYLNKRYANYDTIKGHDKSFKEFGEMIKDMPIGHADIY